MSWANIKETSDAGDRQAFDLSKQIRESLREEEINKTVVPLSRTQEQS